MIISVHVSDRSPISYFKAKASYRQSLSIPSIHLEYDSCVSIACHIFGYESYYLSLGVRRYLSDSIIMYQSESMTFRKVISWHQQYFLKNDN